MIMKRGPKGSGTAVKGGPLKYKFKPQKQVSFENG